VTVTCNSPVGAAWITHAVDVPALDRRGAAHIVAARNCSSAVSLDVLRLLTEGRRNAEIAAQLCLTPKTVAHYVSAILAKLNVATRAEAAVVAVRLGLSATKSGQSDA
jgi:DNA-binding NarL/FixJ family response regulator